MAKFSGRKEKKGKEGERERERGARTRKREKENEVWSRVIVLFVCGGASSCVW